MKTTLKNLVAKRNALNAKINLLKKGKIKAGDIVYLKKVKNDDYDFDHTHHVDPHYNECGRAEFKVVKVNGNKITIKDIEGINDWNTKTFDITRVFICKNPTAEKRLAAELEEEKKWAAAR